MSPITDEAVEAALSAFISSVREQDDEWTDEVDEEILLVGPSGDYIAPLFPMRAALEAALSSAGEKESEWAEDELSGIPGELIDRVAEAIRGDGGHFDDAPWESLSEERKEGWRGDAERALAVVKQYLTAHLPASEVRQSDALAIIERLRAEIEAAENYLRDFLTAFVTEHFPNNESWKPLPDLLGMLSQMDNASTVARDYKARLAEAVEAINEADRFLTHPLDPDDVVCAHDVLRTFLQSLGKEASDDKA